ncbi:hypothetical protein HK102_000140 [Quaeritorhiza haematococci]|nr:hypothetical protein HK102_000140 [Quaeritorhiza haematococci]
MAGTTIATATAPAAKKTYTQSLVASKAVQSASLHVPLPIEWHIYAYPFALPYSIWFYIYLVKYDDWLGSSEFATLSFMLVAALNALAFLICQWSVSAKALLTCRKESDPHKAAVIKIIPASHQGSGAICKLERTVVVAEDGKETTQMYFIFQKRKFIFDESTQLFRKLDFPVAGNTMQTYRAAKGLTSERLLKTAKQKYGANKFDIPIPTFQELFKEHAVAPFFVFQMFCVALWFLDEMWYYSLFTLVMLIVFESTVVFQRLRNLQEFRSMSTKPYPINVYRNGKWTQVHTDDLLPGDLCSVVRSTDEGPVAADMLIIDGACIANEAMLSGESTPQLKESIAMRDADDVFDIDVDRNYVLFGGTKVLQVTQPEKGAVLTTPDGGCLAYVLRTGFSTQQGKLVRTIIYSTERVTANNLESLFFILFLLIFAVIAAWYVWVEGTKNEERKRSKVLLDCILIITSVVPPELPMELSLAVNNSLIALARAYVFCTEPFRIPFAGKVEVLCFDKTGTLTAENLLVEGVAGLGTGKSAESDLKKLHDLPRETTFVLAGAHALVQLDDGVIGDPMEKNTLESIEWVMNKNDTVIPKKGGKHHANASLRILRRFPFSSALKRMSTICLLADGSGVGRNFVAVKGAPEVLEKMYKVLPKKYEEIYKHWARRGSRVLALGYKYLSDDLKAGEIRELTRDEVESDLEFAGFLVFYCPLKPDSAKAVKMLNSSSHRVVMITGDNALTACHVAEEVEIVTRDVLIGDTWEHEDRLTWRTVDEKIEIETDVHSTKVDKRLLEYDLCITGNGLAILGDKPCFAAMLPKLWVYARVSPSQKEFILVSLKQAGYVTLMCGDGTNDVGALKQAHVGIALLDGTPEDMEKLAARLRARRQQQLLEQQKQMREKMEKMGFKLPEPPAPANNQLQAAGSSSSTSSPTRDPRQQALSKAEQRKQQAAEAQAKMQERLTQMMGDMNEEVPTIKFGDASVAAPFTSKISTINSVCNIVRQGRSTLVAMIQMYKILALNCLISAYSMSVLYLAGIKQGDWQATIAGFLITICFFGIAKSSALEQLSKKRPQANIFNAYLLLSVLGQAAVHVGSLIYIRGEAIEYAEELDEQIDLDAEFKPNLLNSAVYLVSLTMQISTFAINYQGLPFRESLRQNKALYNSLMTVGFIAVLAATEFSPALNDWMQLVPFPEEFRNKLLITMGLDFGVAWLIEQVTSALFSDNRPKASLGL